MNNNNNSVILLLLLSYCANDSGRRRFVDVNIGKVMVAGGGGGWRARFCWIDSILFAYKKPKLLVMSVAVAHACSETYFYQKKKNNRKPLLRKYSRFVSILLRKFQELLSIGTRFPMEYMWFTYENIYITRSESKIYSSRQLISTFLYLD